MLFKKLSPLLRSTIGNNFANDEEDIKNLKNNFQSIGRYNTDIKNGIYDRELDTSIKGFQKDNKLRVDGFARPGGETEATLIGEILDLPKDQNEETTKTVAAGILIPPLIGAIGRATAPKLAGRAVKSAWQLWQNMSTDEREDEVDKLECDRMYERDTQTCNIVTKQKGAKAGAVCHQSAADIYAACLKGLPEKERPDLMD